MPVAGYIIAGAIGYVSGSLPTGFLAGKAKGIDIRTFGSGNIGATNVFRILGTPAGIFVLAVDVLKGWLPVFSAMHWIPNAIGAPGGSLGREWMGIVAGLAAVMGHNYTCWLRFKGGKGIATSAGVMLGLVPVALAIGLVLFLLILILTRYMSLASICGAFVLPFATWATTHSKTLLGVTAIMGALAIYRHKSNIKRLLSGTENRLGGRSAQTTAEKES